MKPWAIAILMVMSVPQLLAQQTADTLIANAVRAMHQKEYARSLELLAEAKSLSEENKWYKQHFLALNNMGANYYSMLDYGEALNYYTEAYDLAIKELSAQQEMTVLNNIAILFLREKNYERAVDYLEKAYQLAQEENDPKKIALYAVNLGLAFNSKDLPEKALPYLEEALALEKDNLAVLTEAKIGLAENFLLRDELQKARSLIQELLSNDEVKRVSELHLTALLILSKVAAAQDNFRQAIRHAESALELQTNLESRMLVYEHLTKVYADIGEYRLALSAKDSLLQLNNALNQVKNGKLFETNKVKFEIQNYQRELQDNREKLQRQRQNYFILLGSALVALLLIGWALRNSYLKNKQEKILHLRNTEITALELKKRESDNLLLEKQLKEKETFALLEEERLKHEIETRNRKLSAKALYLSERNELIATIINDLSQDNKIKESPVVKAHIKKLKTLLKSEDEWEAFIKHFEEVNQGLLTTLKSRHPELNANDIRFLSYLYMNLSQKEIAALLNITPEACRKRKERISKKMKLTDKKALYNYLSSI